VTVSVQLEVNTMLRQLCDLGWVHQLKDTRAHEFLIIDTDQICEMTRYSVLLNTRKILLSGLVH